MGIIHLAWMLCWTSLVTMQITMKKTKRKKEHLPVIEKKGSSPFMGLILTIAAVLSPLYGIERILKLTKPDGKFCDLVHFIP